MRKDWDEYFLDIAFQVAGRSTCNRRAVGALVVKDKRIKGTGYNGAPHGLPHCLDAGCLMAGEHCLRTIHAEINALLECSPEEREGATMYVTDYPCERCALTIVQAGIKRLVYARPYHVDHDWLREAGIEIIYRPR